MTLLFWLSITLLAYTFVGYPVLIKFLARFFATPPSPPSKESSAPLVSVVLVVFNAEEQIRARIENLLAQDFPLHEIIVVCDGCTDKTQDEIAAFLDLRIKPILVAVRSGKSNGLNLGIQQATGGIVVLADVRQQFRIDTVSRLVENFSNPEVGAVSGCLEIKASSNSIGKGVDSYWRFEKKLRLTEALFDSCIGCTGAVYAIRRLLFNPLPRDTLLDDVVIPMQIALAGYRVVFEPTSVAFDPQSLDSSRELIRKRRTLAGNFQMLFRYPGWILPWNNRLCLQLISHKYMRLLSPFLLATAFVANFFLLGQPLYRALLVLQFSFYLLGILGDAEFFRKLRLFSLPSSFLFLNLRILSGLYYFLFSAGTGIWEVQVSPDREQT